MLLHYGNLTCLLYYYIIILLSYYITILQYGNIDMLQYYLHCICVKAMAECSGTVFTLSYEAQCAFTLFRHTKLLLILPKCYCCLLAVLAFPQNLTCLLYYYIIILLSYYITILQYGNIDMLQYYLHCICVKAMAECSGTVFTLSYEAQCAFTLFRHTKLLLILPKCYCCLLAVLAFPQRS